MNIYDIINLISDFNSVRFKRPILHTKTGKAEKGYITYLQPFNSSVFSPFFKPDYVLAPYIT